MKYLKYFNIASEYDVFKNSEDYILPNVSFVVESDSVNFDPYVAPVPKNIITYYATDKLVETTSTGNTAGLHINAFNSPMVSHEFANGVGTITFQEDLTSIGSNAFFNCPGLTGITIPDLVTSIGNEAFCSCKGLTGITIPDSVTSIGNRAFLNCSGLKEITCHAVVAPSIGPNTFQGVKKWGKLNYPEGSDYSSWLSTISYYLGYYNWHIEQPVVTAKYNVTSTTENTQLCYSTGNFTDIIIDGEPMASMSTGYTFTTTGEHTVEFKLNNFNIGNRAFLNCSGLTGITIPDSVTSIGDYTFQNCSGMTEVTIPDSVTSIGVGVFSGCSGLTEITIPDSVTSIGYGAFSSCSGLTGTLIIPDSVTSIGGHAFQNCSNLTSINIPDGVTSIENYAFDGCSGLTGTLIIPDSVTRIGDYAFDGCKGLTKIIIGSGVTRIGDYAFRDCSGLTGTLIIPDSVTSIGNEAFDNCKGLTEIIIGSGVTSIGNEAFCSCKGLNKITCNAITAPSINPDTFCGIKSGGILKVPAGSDYSSWMGTGNYYLGKYNWTIEYI